MKRVFFALSLVAMGLVLFAMAGSNAPSIVRASGRQDITPTPGVAAATPQEGQANATPAATTASDQTTSGHFALPPTLNDLVSKYPDLQPYLTKIAGSKPGQMDLQELYAKIAEIYNQKSGDNKYGGAERVGIFLKESGLLDKLGIPERYIQLLTAFDQGGMQAVIAKAKEWKLINDKDELIGFLFIDPATKVPDVTTALQKLAVSTYAYSDKTQELQIGVPLALLQDRQDPAAILAFFVKIGNIDGVAGYRVPDPGATTIKK